MGVPGEPALDADVVGLPRLRPRPPIPERGLVETLRSWSGQGQLWEALGTGEDVAERAWTPAMIRSRARRVLFERLHERLATWPEDARDWLDALPASTETLEHRSTSPRSGVSWTRTRIAGWPPRNFVGRERRRVPETLLSTVTRWTLEQLEPLVREATKLNDPHHRTAVERAETALSLLGVEPLREVTAARPTPPDLAAVAAEGHPWRSLVPVAEALLAAEDPEALASLALEVVGPIDELSGRLFHLAILGEVLHGLRTAGAHVVSRHPLGNSWRGPAYRVVDARDREWDLWFEAAGAWGYYQVDEHYPKAAKGVPGAGGALGTDLMLIRRDQGALLLECKHSWNPAVVARDGYLQAVAYATEALDLAPAITSVVVGPEGVVKESGFTTPDPAMLVGIVRPYDVPKLIEHALDS